jgi:hypothetical protein
MTYGLTIQGNRTTTSVTIRDDFENLGVSELIVDPPAEHLEWNYRLMPSINRVLDFHHSHTTI